MRTGLRIWIKFSKFPADNGRSRPGKKEKENGQETYKGRNTFAELFQARRLQILF